MPARPQPLYSKNSISKTCNKETVKNVLDTSLLTPLGHLVNNDYPLLTFKFQIPTIYSAILCKKPTKSKVIAHSMQIFK